MSFDVGTRVRVVRCEVCPAVVDKTAVVKSVTEDNKVCLNFGRGRPSKDRPMFFNAEDLAIEQPKEQEETSNVTV